MSAKNNNKKSRFSFLYIAAIGFTAISALSFLIHKLPTDIEIKNQHSANKLVSQVKGYKTYTPIPQLNPTADFPLMSAQGVLAVDLDSRIPLYEKNPDEAFLPASTVKIITALVAMDYYPPDYVMRIDDVSVVGQKMGLYLGEEITAQNLMYGLLIHSANDAAEAFAYNYPGGHEAFVDAMNEKATEMHLENTLYKNPTGLDGGGQLTTARDLIRIAEQAMNIPEFAEIVKQSEKSVESFNGKVTHKLTTTNQLLGEIDGVLGVKTGWTENARENLVTYIDRDGHRIMIAVLSSQDRFGETKELIDWIFDNYTWKEVIVEVE
jgi:serine-type D-Ala-D-Ala carboxypeptidase (penicillin-binding protein 5/6)